MLATLLTPPKLDGMLDADEKFFKQNGIPLFSSHMIDLVWCPLSETSLFKIKLTNNSPVRRTDPLQLLPGTDYTNPFSLSAPGVEPH